MVRALHRSIFGRRAGAGFFSISRQRTPRRPRSTASVSPTGPAPTMRTCVSIGFLVPATGRGLHRAQGFYRIRRAREIRPLAFPNPSEDPRMAKLDLLLDELVTANRILAHEGVVDGFGHV